MDSIQLIGSDDVRRAGHNIQSAAEDMKRAADIIDSALMTHRQYLEDWITRFEQVIEKFKTEVVSALLE
jgi:hypothetical protein